MCCKVMGICRFDIRSFSNLLPSYGFNPLPVYSAIHATHFNLRQIKQRTSVLPKSASEASLLGFMENDQSLLQQHKLLDAASGKTVHSGDELEIELNPMSMPRHVAIIMDGNARWAEKRGLAVNSGHEAGVEALRNVVGLSSRWGIQVLTVFALSTENWLRPEIELSNLMNLIEQGLRYELPNFTKENICVRFIGNLSKLPTSLQNLISFTERSTQFNDGLKLLVALSYSGRQDIVQACQLLVSQAVDGLIQPMDITESMVEDMLLTNVAGDLQNPDLLIRTSGEQRVSNFLLWQMAYTEFCFVDAFWPDFGEVEYRKALLSYQRRNRRHGTRH